MTPPLPSYLRPVLHIIIIPGPVHKQQDRECDEEEYAIHNAKCEARLLHCAIFLDIG